MERKQIIQWIHVCPNRRTNINSKNGRNKSFSYETKSLILFIPMRGLCLWCPIMKGKKTIMWIHVYANWQTNTESKKWWQVKFFLWNQSINSFILMRRMNWWCLIFKRKEIIMWIHVCPNWWTNTNSKNGRKRSFSCESKGSISFIPMRKMCSWCPIMKKRDYHINPCLA